MPCDVARAEILLLHRAEMFGGKTACATAIDRHKVIEQSCNPDHTYVE